MFWLEIRINTKLVTLCEHSHITYTIVRPPRLVDSCLTLHYGYAKGNDILKGGKGVMSRADVAAFMLQCMFDKENSSLLRTNQAFNMDTTKAVPKEHDTVGLMTFLSWTLPRHQYIMIRMGVHSVQVGALAVLAYYLFPGQTRGWWKAITESVSRFVGRGSSGHRV